MTTQILCVDDEMIFHTLYRNLKSFGGVIPAYDGKEALTMLESHPDVKLVLTDNSMPEMSGLEFLQASSGIQVPRYLVSADAKPAELHAQAKKWGACGLIVKPFSLQDLRIIVEETLGLGESPSYRGYVARKRLERGYSLPPSLTPFS